MEYQDLYFNIDHGYLEGLVRGFKAGILKQTDYLNLVQCETLEGHKLSSIFSSNFWTSINLIGPVGHAHNRLN